MIYVRSKDGKALMPSERGGRIGYLLRHGKAHVVSRVPFIVQLDYESTTYTQEVSLGIDAGSKHIGVSASSEKKELLAAQVELRNDVMNLLSTRRELRQTRRNRKTRYRKSRFQRFDMVRWKGKECFIFGSTNGRPILRYIEGIQVANQPSVNIKTIKFLKRIRYNILVEERTSESWIENES